MSKSIITRLFAMSMRNDIHLKQSKGVDLARGWKAVNWTMSELAAHCASGKAMGVSVWKGGYRKAENVLETHILGLDFENGGKTAEMLATDEWLKPFAGVIMPTASDTPEAPRARVFIPLTRSVTSDEYKRLYTVFVSRYEGSIDRSTSDTARFFFGACPDPSRVFVNDYALLDVDKFLLEHPLDEQKGRKLGRNTIASVVTPQSLENALKRDFKPVAIHGGNEVEREVLDLLQYAARLWAGDEKPPYDTWLSTVFAAHHASNGSALVRDYIASNPLFWRWNDNAGFVEWWNTAVKDETAEPITIGTLKHYARLAGWGTHTQFALKRVDKVVNGRYLSDVLTPDDLPSGANVLIKQQTGGGKTTFAFEAAKRFHPSRVLYIAPFITLNFDLAGKSSIPTNVYKDQNNWNEKGALAATFQYLTEKGYDPARYGLIVIEEIHQVLGHLLLKSHMKPNEIVKALLFLRDALRSKATVLMVDAGINANTVEFIERLSGEQAYVIVNEHVQPKSPVTLIDPDTALGMLLQASGKGVVAADGRKTARLYHDWLGGRGMLITGETSNQAGVRAFMRDVENGARTASSVVYNGAMGSGVSISETMPDLLIQVCEHWGASTQIQLLNRYRNQPENVYLVYSVKKHTRIDETTARASVDRKYAAEYESLQRLIGATAGEKSDIAKIVDDLHVKLLIEQNEQLIDPLAYYRETLKADGRELLGQGAATASETIKQLRAADREAVKREYPNWRLGVVLDRESEQEIADMDRVDLIRSGLHTTVFEVFKRDPVAGGKWNDIELYLAANRYQKGIGHIERALSPHVDVTSSLLVIASADSAKHQARLWAAVYLLLKSCAFLLPDLRGRLTHEALQEGAGKFIGMIENLEKQYNAVVDRSRDYLSNLALEQEGAELALTLLNKVLGKVGINLKAVPRRQRVNGKPDYARDANGKRINDYVVEDVDLLVEILAHRKAVAESKDEVVADVVNTVWSDGATDIEDYINELVKSGKLVEWATKVQAETGGNKRREQLALDLLYPDDVLY
ncbi:MAG: hypothetical protein HZC41_17935 [Chloroflexi bacterium]|nr:hypothetical protein [Chloroflexota bacterium]